jgi:hypothetical protein
MRPLALAALLAMAAPAGAANVDPGSFAWSENGGWINFAPTAGPGVTVSTTGLSGHAWSENFGWIDLAPLGIPVANDGLGNLSGYAWGENTGWIHFAPAGGGVTVDLLTGRLTGYAWSETLGWVNFGVASAVTTSWRTDPALLPPAGDLDHDGIPNGVEVAEGRSAFVKDNDIFSPGAGAARLFAMQMYRDFLSREGDPAGIAGWSDVVASGAWSRLQVIDAFLQSQEFAGFVAPVVRLYFATYLRVPDYDGLTFNAGLVRSGAVTLPQLADFFTAGPEFVALYGALDNTQFVTLLYNNVLGRAPDPAGLAGWVSLLDGGYTRGQVLLGFSDSAEYQAAMANEVFVTMMYAGMLRRTPEPAGFAGWVQFLDDATYTREQVINGFFLSTEYHDRFLP